MINKHPVLFKLVVNFLFIKCKRTQMKYYLNYVYLILMRVTKPIKHLTESFDLKENEMAF